MDRKDMVSLKFAMLPINMQKKGTRQLLEALERKYPTDYNIKKQLVLYFVENQRFSKALVRIGFLALKYRKFEDLGLLLCLSFEKNRLTFYFGDLNLLEKIDDEDEKAFLKTAYEKLRDYRFELDYNRLFDCKRISKFKMPHIFIANESKYEYKYEYKYHQTYVEAIENVAKGNIKRALDLTLDAFNVSTYFDAIQFMIENEKIDLLGCLSKRSLFFKKYYKATRKRINQSLVTVLNTIILLKSKVLLEKFSNLLKRVNYR